MSRRIVGLCGLAGSGKTAVASHLMREHLFHRVRFAGPLKSMMAALGLSEREIDGDLKEKPCELLGGKTPRWAMQTIGTQWGRELISPTLWVDAWSKTVNDIPKGIGVVSDDIRFENELEIARSVSKRFVLIKIDRPGHTRIATSNHVSEKMPFKPDLTVINDGSLEDLFDVIDKVVARI